MDVILHPKKSNRNLGIGSMLLFLGAMVFSFFAALCESGILAAVLLASCWAFFVAVSAVVLLAYYRKSLSMTADKIVQTGIVRRREMARAEVVGVRWRLMPAGGSAVLHSSATKIKVTFDDFEPEQRRWLIREFRLSLPQAIQQEWEGFCVRIALPLLKNRDDEPLRADEVLLTRRRWDRLFLALTLLMTATGAVCAWLYQNAPMLFLPVSCLLLWLMVRLGTPRGGMRCKRMSAAPEGKLVLFLAIWGVIGLAVLPRLKNELAIIGLMVVWFAVLLYQCHRLDRRREAARDAVAAAAAEEWEQLENAARGFKEESSSTTEDQRRVS